MDLSALDPLKLLIALLIAATPLILAAIGEAVCEKSGVLNLGVEGMMIMGAVSGFIGAVASGNPYFGMMTGAFGGLALSLLFALLTQYLRANQVATGLALTLFGLGLAALLGQSYSGLRPPITPKIEALDMLRDVTHLGAVFLLLGIITPLLTHLFLTRTHAGLILRAVGEDHDAAHSIGYHVLRIRTYAISFGGFMAGLGGASIALVRVPQWTEGMTAGTGWIALALVVFGTWRPLRVMIGAYLFGGINILQLNLQGAGIAVQAEYLAMAPYLMTIIVLALMSRRAREIGAPASLGRVFRP